MVSLGMTRGDGVRRAQITDKQTNTIAVHTTAGFGDRGPGFTMEESSGLEDILWGLLKKMALLFSGVPITKSCKEDEIVCPDDQALF